MKLTTQRIIFFSSLFDFILIECSSMEIDQSASDLAQSSNQNEKWECSICGKKMCSKSKLQMHYRLHSHPHAVFTCGEESCGEVCLNEQQLQKHMYSHRHHTVVVNENANEMITVSDNSER